MDLFIENSKVCLQNKKHPVFILNISVIIKIIDIIPSTIKRSLSCIASNAMFILDFGLKFQNPLMHMMKQRELLLKKLKASYNVFKYEKS